MRVAQLFTEQQPVGWLRRPDRAAGSRSDKKLHHTRVIASGHPGEITRHPARSFRLHRSDPQAVQDPAARRWRIGPCSSATGRPAGNARCKTGMDSAFPRPAVARSCGRSGIAALESCLVLSRFGRHSKAVGQAGWKPALRQSFDFDDFPSESPELDFDSLFDSDLDSDFDSDFDSELVCDFESASAAFLYESLR